MNQKITAKQILVGSICLNLALLSFIGAGLLAGSASSEPDDRPLPIAPEAPQRRNLAAAPPKPLSDANETPSRGNYQPALDNLDHNEQLAALEAAGWARTDAQDLIMGRLVREDLMSQTAQAPDYWVDPSTFTPDWKQQRLNIERRHRRDEVLEDFLGIRPGTGGGPSPLPREKLHAARSIDQDYSMMRTKLQMESNRISLPEDREAIRLLQEERRRDLKELLSDEELFEYEIRNSSMAMKLRRRLGALEPTEEEFRAIFRHQYDAENSSAPSNQADEAQLREALGEGRFRQYKRAQDHGYAQLMRVAQRLELPRERVDDVYDLKESMDRQRQELQSLADEERQAALQALRAKTHQDLTEILGEDAVKVYQQNGGHWIQQLR